MYIILSFTLDIEDYVGVNDTLEFGPGADPFNCIAADDMAVCIPIVNDTILETEESFYINLNTDDPRVNLLISQAEVVITDDDRKSVGREGWEGGKGGREREREGGKEER